MSQMFVLSIYVLMAQAKVEAESRFNGGGTSALSNEPQQQQLQVNLNAWQPLTGHNNWLILQATASTSMQQEKQQQHQRHPVNYYAYNHRFQTKEHAAAAADNGNYKQVRTNPNDSPSPSYVLAISQLPPSDVGQDTRDRPETREAGNFVGLTNDNDEPVDDLDNNSMASLDIMNYFEPFQHAMHKVRSFCDTVREIISMGTAENEEEEMQQLSDAESNRWEENTSLATTTTTSKEVQGRLSRLPAISQSRRVKKLKRRLQKLFLPLLIAYKLKFLTLIPVLIGGLTLLVGTTGLAGFFFALFTAVMSLKSSTGGGVGHSSKATLFKKI